MQHRVSKATEVLPAEAQRLPAVLRLCPVLVEELDDELRRLVLDLVDRAVDDHLVEDEHLVPRRRQRLVNHLQVRGGDALRHTCTVRTRASATVAL